MSLLLLSKYKKEGKDREEWESTWASSSYTLEPLAYALLELAGDGAIKEESLKGGDAYARMAYQAGARAAYLRIFRLLPKGIASAPYYPKILLDKPYTIWYLPLVKWFNKARN